jgi:hypothetical protein
VDLRIFTPRPQVAHTEVPAGFAQHLKVAAGRTSQCRVWTALTDTASRLRNAAGRRRNAHTRPAKKNGRSSPSPGFGWRGEPAPYENVRPYPIPSGHPELGEVSAPRRDLNPNLPPDMAIIAGLQAKPAASRRTRLACGADTGCEDCISGKAGRGGPGFMTSPG